MSNNIKLNKIPIESFLQTLSLLYERGADYFDIEAIVNTQDKQDVITISTIPEYFSDLENEDDDDLDYENLI